MKIIISLVFLFSTIIMTGCIHTPTQNEAVIQDKYLGYQPVEPIEAEKVTIYNMVTKRKKRIQWAELSDDAKRKLLPLQSALVSVRKSDVSGKLSYLGSSIGSAKGSYEVTMDYMKYRVEKVLDSNGKYIGSGRVGVGLRITAVVTTSKSDLNLANLAAIGLEASRGNLQGGLSVDIIGVDSEAVTNLIPLTTQIDQTAIQTSLQAVASIKTKIWEQDKKVTITPHLIAIKQDKPNMTDKIRGEVIGYFDSNSKKLLAEFWMPDGKNVNQANLKRLKDWMNKEGLSTAPGMITKFVNAKEFEAHRQKAVREFVNK